MVEDVREHEGGLRIDCFGDLELWVGGIGGWVLELSQLWYKPRELGLTGNVTAWVVRMRCAWRW